VRLFLVVTKIRKRYDIVERNTKFLHSFIAPTRSQVRIRERGFEIVRASKKKN
jgi:hypothetical protein